MATVDDMPRYRLGPRSTRGLIAGWRTSQILCVGLGLLLSIGVLRSVGSAPGLILALACTGCAVAAATWPVGGRSAEQWAPTVVRYLLLGAADGRFRPWSPAPGRRGPLGRLSLFELPSAGADAGAVVVGVVEDQMNGTWSAVVRVEGDGFALLSEAERARRISAWSSVLAAVATDTAAPYRLQWIARTYPDSLDGPSADLPDSDLSAARDYEQLVEEASRELWAREVLLVITVRRPPRGAVARGRRSRSDRSDPRALLLRHQLDRLTERLRAAGLFVSSPLSPSALAKSLRQSFDLTSSEMPVVWPWPSGVRESWSMLVTDEAYHATYWIAEWPRSDVGTDFLLPMLVGSGIRRAVSLTLAPLPPLSAVRRAEHERTSGAADAELRRRHGFSITARSRREQDAREQRESELAGGHAGFLYSGYVTVTERTEAELEEACRRVEQVAAVAQLELRRLYGSQEEGLCCTLPTGRGCR